MAAAVQLVSLPPPSGQWLIEHGFAFECGMRPDYDCEACAEAGPGRACEAHRFPGIGIAHRVDRQLAAYVDNVGHKPPVSDSPQWAWKKRKGGPSAVDLAVAGMSRLTIDEQINAAELALAKAETALSDAYESGNDVRIQRAETRLSDATERIEKLRDQL